MGLLCGLKRLIGQGVVVGVYRATTEQVLLEVERDVCVLLNDLQDLDALCDDLVVKCEPCIRKPRMMLLPQVQHRHLDAISGAQLL